MGPTYRLRIWWHRKRAGHHTYMRRVDYHLTDATVMVTCDCGKVWQS